jgi:K+-sensing histidine kinase KdpD
MQWGLMFSAWFGGFEPGILGSVLSVLAFSYFFVPPIHSFAVEMAEIPRTAVFALAAFFVGHLAPDKEA